MVSALFSLYLNVYFHKPIDKEILPFVIRITQWGYRYTVQNLLEISFHYKFATIIEIEPYMITFCMVSLVLSLA